MTASVTATEAYLMGQCVGECDNGGLCLVMVIALGFCVEVGLAW